MKKYIVYLSCKKKRIYRKKYWCDKIFEIYQLKIKKYN